MKTCSKCGEAKELVAFSKKAANKDGLHGWCKLCMSIAHKKWREANPEKEKVGQKKWREANAEKVKAINKKYREANPEKEKARCKKYCEANPEKEKARCKKYCEANPEKARARQKKYYEANPEKIKVKNKKYCETLHDLYLKNRITRQFQIPRSEIPPEMIELKRIELENKRLKKELKK